MNSFDSIKLVLFRTDDLKYRITRDIIQKSEKENKQIIEFSSEEDLSLKISQIRNKFRSKEVLILKEFMGRKFQKCPGSPNVICCNYYLLNTCFNCLYNCTYCFLNSYLNSFGIVQFVNLEDLAEVIKTYCSSVSNPVRIGTGEFTDSLMFDSITSIASELINSTSFIPNLFLEFKTKSSIIEHLENIDKKGNTVLAWSVNTQININLYEEGASNIQDRISAAAKAQKLGYNTAFHFDPIIQYPSFIKDYYEIIEIMANKLNPSQIIWISLGCFRYSPGFKDIIKNSFPQEQLTTAEMFPGRDGKFRYIVSQRVDIFKKISEKLKFHFPDVFIYLCMEDQDVWYKVFGKKYAVSEDLEYDFNRYLKENFMK